MLNRIYIVVGIFAIVVLSSAFILPRFIQWGDYRDRMEVLASQVLGTEVAIRGDISFSLLPSPRLEFDDVIVGPPATPVASVRRVEAEFALMDFLRDIYNATSLKLIAPVVDFSIDENGLLSSGVDMSNAGNGVGLAHASISEGVIRLTDLRSHESFSVKNLGGDLRMSSFSGPFQFQGAGEYDTKRYELRFNSGAASAEGAARVSAFVRDMASNVSLNADGQFEAGRAPKFDGTIIYRQPPQLGARAEDITGDLVLESKLTASTDRIVFTGYSLSPDQNRAGMRLTGTASIQLGENRNFDAVVSGGVFSLPPRDANEVAAEQAYEFVRLLGEISAPPIPNMPGKLGIDLAEISLRGFALRNLRVDATTDGTNWKVAQATGLLPGQTETRFAGTVTNNDGEIGVIGDIVMKAQRLDALASLWRKPSDDSPLFNVPGELHGRVRLGGDAFGLTNGWITLGGQDHGLDLRIGFGSEPRLDTVLRLGELNRGMSEALFALAPNAPLESNFLVSFPDGSFSIQAQELDVLGLPAEMLVAEAQWSRDAIRFSRLAVEDWGGVGFNGTVRLGGSLVDPKLTLSGSLKLKEAGSAGASALYEMANMPFAWHEALEKALPADLLIGVANAEGGSGQIVTANGRLAEAAVDFRMETQNPVTAFADGRLSLVASLEASDGAALFENFGWTGPELFIGEGSLVGSAFIDGSQADGFSGRVSLGQDGQSVAYFGKFGLLDGGELSGEGILDVLLTDGSGLASFAGIGGARLPGVEASAELKFDAAQSFVLSNISGVSGEAKFAGSLSMERIGQMPGLGGSIRTDSLDIEALAAVLLGSEALILGEGQVWSEGPLATTLDPRQTRGNIEVSAPELTFDARAVAGATKFILSWDQQVASIGRFEAVVGDGVVSGAISNCCAGALTERTLSGHATVAGVEAQALVPAIGISGIVEGSVQFEGAGHSLADVARSLSGEGHFAVQGMGIDGLFPGVYPALVGVSDVLNTPIVALEAQMKTALASGQFTAETAPGAFTIAGGTVRLSNMFIDGATAQLLGGVNLSLGNLGLSGSYVMTPKAFEDPRGLVELDSARIVNRISGTLVEPITEIDLSEISAAVQVRANEIELDRLEQLRIEDAERQRAAAEERNRLIEEQRRIAAEEAAKKAAQEAARRAAEEEAARQALEQAEQAQQRAREDALSQQNQQTIEMLIQGAPDLDAAPIPFTLPTQRPFQPMFGN